MTPIAEVAARIRANPAPVLVTDTCCFLDLFRVARPTKETEERRVEIEELKAASELLAILTEPEPTLYHVVPELVPGEFADNADSRVTEPFRKWVEAQDAAVRWIAEVAVLFQQPSLPPSVSPDLPKLLRDFAEGLLNTAAVLARDNDCLLRAVDRLIGKKRPSHKKEMKDSMNLEQALELCRQLSADGKYAHPIVFVSSNTSDFAASPKSADIHPDLKAEFDAVGLVYRTSFRAARGFFPKQNPK